LRLQVFQQLLLVSASAAGSAKNASISSALTLVNVRWLLDPDGKLTITWPAGLSAEELAPVLQIAA
jgi:hypothetical protein